MKVIFNVEGTEIVQRFCVCLFEGDVLSGTSSSGVHHAGVLEGWFGEHWWTGRFFILLITTLAIFSPLACFKRIGKYRALLEFDVLLAFWSLYELILC